MGRHAGWTENLAGFQGPFCTSLQALPDPQYSNISGPWVWDVIKSYTGDRGPSQHCGCAASTRMCSNGRQVGNGEPHQHQPHIISEPNSSTRDDFVLSKKLQALQVHTKVNKPSTKRTALDQKTKDVKSKCYCRTHGRTHRLDHTSATWNFPKTGHQVGAIFGGGYWRKREVVWGVQGPRIGCRGEKHCSGEN